MKEIEKYLLGKTDSRETYDQLREQIRKEIVKEAQEAVNKYEEECRQAEPQAKLAVKEVILPWWQEFRNSKTFSLLKTPNWLYSSIDISERFEHNWPRRLYQEVAERRKPFEWSADMDASDLMNQEPKEIKVAQSVRKKRSFSETFQTKFYLAESNRRLFVNRWPRGASGFYFSGHSREVDFEDFGVGLDSIHPVLFTRLGETIKTGEVWKVIESSIKKVGR